MTATLFTVLILLVAICLIVVILIQNSKGGGLASNVGLSNQMVGGVKNTADFVEKATWYLAAALIVLSILSGFAYTGKKTANTTQDSSVITDFELPQNSFPQQPAPEQE